MGEGELETIVKHYLWIQNLVILTTTLIGKLALNTFDDIRNNIRENQPNPMEVQNFSEGNCSLRDQLTLQVYLSSQKFLPLSL